MNGGSASDRTASFNLGNHGAFKLFKIEELFICLPASIDWARTMTFPFSRTMSAVVVLMLGAIAAHAAPVTVPNSSFEMPVSPILKSPSQSAKTTTDSTSVPGWVFSINGPSQYGTRSIAANFSSTGAASGNNYAFINNDQNNVTDTITSAMSLGTIEGQTRYTLTVAVGNPTAKDSSNYGSPGNISFSLLANGVAFATDTVSNGTVANGTFQDFTLTFTTPGTSAIVGEALEIQLASLPEAAPTEPAFDNITLDVTLVPEPATWALVVLGALAVMGFGARRRSYAA
jgi:hypothetical protein